VDTKTDAGDGIVAWRDKIDALDRQLVELLNQRSECARQIGKLKRERGLPVYEPNREVTVHANIAQANHERGGPLTDMALRRMFERIIDEMRAIQKEEPK